MLLKECVCPRLHRVRVNEEELCPVMSLTTAAQPREVSLSFGAKCNASFHTEGLSNTHLTCRLHYRSACVENK